MIANAGKEDDADDAKDKKPDPGISQEQAFNSGIDWFTEIVCFYGVLLGVCYWEFKKFQAGQRKLN